jgi:hypothetical protein
MKVKSKDIKSITDITILKNLTKESVVTDFGFWQYNRRTIVRRKLWRTLGKHLANTGERRRSSLVCPSLRKFARSSPRTGQRFVKKIFNLD